MILKKQKTLSGILIGAGLLGAAPVLAICPVCVVAVSAGLGLSEYLGIDDTIAGVWIGGMLISLIVWTINWLNQKNWLASRAGAFSNRDRRDILVVILYYGLTFWPLWSKGLIGHPYNQLFGIDKLVLGTIIGSLGFLGATGWYNNIKKTRGHAHFPFQKVVMPVSALLILSLFFYFLTA